MLGLAWVLTAVSAQAGPIGPSAFSAAASIDNFSDLDVTEGLSIGGAIIGRSLVRNGATYASSDSVIKWIDLGPVHSFGPALSSFGDDDYIDVIFAIPVARAGVWIGNQDVLSQFFDSAGTMLGQVFADHQFQPVFVGWEDSAFVSRIRLTDVTSAQQVFVLDRVTSEVPEAGSGSLVILGVAILALARCPTRRSS